MSSATAPGQGGVIPLGSTILTGTDHAVLGAQLGSIGLEPTQVAALMALVESLAAEAAKDIGKKIGLALVPMMANMVEQTHRATALRIMREIQLNAGSAILASHTKCIRAAWDESERKPSQVVPVIDVRPTNSAS